MTKPHLKKSLQLNPHKSVNTKYVYLSSVAFMLRERKREGVGVKGIIVTV